MASLSCQFNVVNALLEADLNYSTDNLILAIIIQVFILFVLKIAHMKNYAHSVSVDKAKQTQNKLKKTVPVHSAMRHFFVYYSIVVELFCSKQIYYIEFRPLSVYQ